MAHEKIAATTVPVAPAMVEFSYETANLFDTVSLQSTYMTKQMVTGAGVNIGEDYALSEDERDAFNLSLDITMSEIFEIFLKQTSGIQDAYSITESEVKVTILDNNAYNNNVLTLVDMAIKDCIVAGCLKGWFEVCSHADLFKMSSDKYFMSKEILKRRLFQLKKKRAFSS